MNPLISVLTPFYNAVQTLSFSLSSLSMQTYSAWECILVDDGSEDDPQQVLEKIQDPRIRYFKLETNQGRGFARQYALEQAQGHYISFLDADDWIYPTKLERQLNILESYPDLSLVSSGMAIADQQNEIIGVRGTKPDLDSITRFMPLQQPTPINVPFAASMIRRSAALGANFDTSLRRSEDADYLMQIVMEHEYAMLNEALYVYCEFISVEKKDLLAGYEGRIEVFSKYLASYPLASRKVILETWFKRLVYGLAFDLGLGDQLVRRRSRRPTPTEDDEYRSNYNNLQLYIQQHTK